MTGKLPLLVGYLTLLLILSASPWRIFSPSVTARIATWNLPAIGIAALSVFALLAFRADASWQWLVLALCAALFQIYVVQSGRNIASALAVLFSCACSTLLLWWVKPADASLFGLLLCFNLWCLFGAALASKGLLTTQRIEHWALVGLLTFGCWALMRYGAFETRTHWLVAWHHWGAYWGPVETIKAGLIPFFDIPLQYGTGPTALLSLLPVKKGFDGMRHIVLLVSLVGSFLVIDLCVLALRPLKSTFASFAAGLAAATACMLWVATPPVVSSAMTTPSTFGLRFMPVFFLLWLLIRFPLRQKTAFAAWAFCSVWSIESAFYSAVIYWPAQINLDLERWSESALRQFIKTLLRAILSTVGLVLIWWVVYRWAFGVNPSLRLYLIYALFPPGPMPVNWTGPIWWLLSIFVFSVLALYSRTTSPQEKRVVHLSALCLAACSSYYLGRSHDNNVLNLMPPCVLLLCAIIGCARSVPLILIPSRVCLAAVIALVPFFGFEAWQVAQKAPKHAWSQQMSFLQGALYSPDLIKAIQYVREDRKEYFEVIDEGPANFQAYGTQGVWNGLHPLSNYPDVPSEDRVKILRAARNKLNSAGWLIIQDNRAQNPIIADFLSVYRPVEEHRFGTFVATRLVPKP